MPPSQPSPSHSLLFLHSPPSPVNSTTISAAYHPPITSVVSALRELPSSTKLLIVVPCPTLHARLDDPRSQIYDSLQHLLAAIYSLFCAICAKEKVDVELNTPGSIDARIIVLDSEDGNGQSRNSFSSGPIITIPELALARRRWNLIFRADGAEVLGLVKRYTDLAKEPNRPLQGQIQVVEGGTSIVEEASSHIQEQPSQSHSAKTHHVVAVGGTFDHIHAGHKLLLTATALLLQPPQTSSFLQSTPIPRRLIVGITGDELLKNKKYAEHLGSWKQRQADVVDFLLSILLFTTSSVGDSTRVATFNSPGPNGKAIHTQIVTQHLTIECVEIEDPFGPTITDEDITALVVSGETRSGGQAINDKRAEKGWHALEVFEIDVLDAQEDGNKTRKTDDFASKISSTAIRKRLAEKGHASSL